MNELMGNRMRPIQSARSLRRQLNRQWTNAKLREIIEKQEAMLRTLLIAALYSQA